MDNAEEVLMELNHFLNSKAPPESLPPVLEGYLAYVAKTGATVFPWTKIKPVFRAKLETVITEFSPNPGADDIPPVPNVDQFSFCACKEKVFQQLDCFNGIPFTVQRLCELLISPRKHYKRTDKFMRALEKNMLIVSTVDPVHFSRADSCDNEDGMKPPSTSKKSLMNGIDQVASSPSRSAEPKVSEDKSAPFADALTDDFREDTLGPCDSGKTMTPAATIASSSDSVSSDDTHSQDLESLSKDEASPPPTVQSDSHLGNMDLISGSDDSTGPCDSAEDQFDESELPKPDGASSSSSQLDLDSTSSSACRDDGAALSANDSKEPDQLPRNSGPTQSSEDDSSSINNPNTEVSSQLSSETQREEISESSEKGPCDSEDVDMSNPGSEAASIEDNSATDEPTEETNAQ